MCEFRLKYAKLHNLGICGTGTTLFGTGTDLVLLGGIGTACISTGTDWLLLGGTGTASKFLPRNANFATFGTNSLHTTSIFHNTSRINMEFIKNHSITLELVVWSLIPQNHR